MGFQVQVIADNSGKWAGNAKVYKTREEAEAAAADLASRWTLVRDWRVIQVLDNSDPLLRASRGLCDGI